MKKQTVNTQAHNSYFPESNEMPEIEITEEELIALEDEYQVLTNFAFPFQ